MCTGLATEPLDAPTVIQSFIGLANIFCVQTQHRSNKITGPQGTAKPTFDISKPWRVIPITLYLGCNSCDADYILTDLQTYILLRLTPNCTTLLVLIPQWKGYLSVLLNSFTIKMQGNAPLGIYATYDWTPDLSLWVCSGYTSCEPILPSTCILLSHWLTSASDYNYNFAELKEESRCFMSHCDVSLLGKKHQFDLAGLNVPCGMCELLALCTLTLLTQGSSVAPYINIHIWSMASPLKHCKSATPAAMRLNHSNPECAKD